MLQTAAYTDIGGRDCNEDCVAQCRVGDGLCLVLEDEMQTDLRKASPPSVGWHECASDSLAALVLTMITTQPPWCG